jgi:hypothetical protein
LIFYIHLLDGALFLSFQLFSDSEVAFAQVLKLDKHCEDAMFELARVRVQQLEVKILGD